MRTFGWVCVSLAVAGSVAYAAAGAFALTILGGLARIFFPEVPSNSGLSLFFQILISDCAVPIVAAGALVLTKPASALAEG